MNYNNVPAATFAALGRVISNRHEPNCARSERVETRRFKAYFGCSPERCAQLWFLIRKLPAARALTKGGEPVHLLWALLWLKIYNTDEVCSGMCRCDEKTYRKWRWKFVKGMAALQKHVVRLQRHSDFLLNMLNASLILHLHDFLDTTRCSLQGCSTQCPPPDVD